MRIASVASALPVHRYEQSVLAAFAREHVWNDQPEVARRIESFFTNTRVETRHLALPLERYASMRTFGEFNDAWIGAATDLGEQAVRTALDRAGLAPRDVDALVFSTVTGVASPSIDARLVNRLGLRPDVKRMPMFGLGCVAGASALSRAADLVAGPRVENVVVLTIELCSLTVQREDRSVANLIASGLFGDGAAAAVVVGERSRARPGPRIVATRSVFYPDTEHVMGWHIGERGFGIVLSPAVPTVAREHIGEDVDAFLDAQGLARRDIAAWICHPGGPKVLEAVRDALALDDRDVELSWRSLARVGNLSSASVLFVLEATLAERPPAKGSRGVLLAMGPGFCSELVLLEF
ncbi:MAG: type III polyketide synthase [Planctomycetes bacterium]|nr:type III polyketide synthase [Planctomycetota bacterium]